jgi:hypothetical protein
MLRMTLVLVAVLVPPASSGQDPQGFSKDQRWVAAVTYAWYDAETDERLKNGDGSDALTDHFPALKGVSYRRPEWHRKELLDMAAAKIDVALFAWRPGEAWCAESAKAMVQALEALEKEGKPAPRVAVFVEGTEPAKAAREFHAIVPARFRAFVEGRPVVGLGPVEGAGAPDLGDAWVIADRSWKAGDAVFAWGAARTGPVEGEAVVAVGPGYDDTSVPGRKTPPRDREKGVFYQRSWCVASRCGARIVVIQTWNNFHEATEICESREHARAYLEATAAFAERFKRGDAVANPVGAWTRAKKAQWNLKYEPFEAALRPVATEDGPFDIVEMVGVKMATTKQAGKAEWRHLHFAVDDSWIFYEKRSIEVVVEFLDTGKGTFFLQYDSADRAKSGAERHAKTAGEEPFTGSGEWRKATFSLPDALFGNHQAGGADFRIAVKGRGIAVRAVRVTPK